MNKLNVFNYYKIPFRLSNIPEILKSFFRAFKHGYQRVTRGYADSDVWNLDEYYARLLYETLSCLKNNHHGYPHEYTDESYSEELSRLANYFLNVLEEESEKKNEFKEEYTKEILSRKGYDFNRLSDVAKKYLDRDTELFEERKQNLHDGLQLLEELWFDLWD